MTHEFTPVGVCSRKITIELDEDGTILDIKFLGGCNGNTQGVSKLCKGRKAEEVIELLRGIDCQGRGTSCPDQLSYALEEALELI